MEDFHAQIEQALDTELATQKATDAERSELRQALLLAQQNRILEVGLRSAIWATPLLVQNALRRHRERAAHEARRAML